MDHIKWPKKQVQFVNSYNLSIAIAIHDYWKSRFAIGRGFIEVLYTEANFSSLCCWQPDLMTFKLSQLGFQLS